MRAMKLAAVALFAAAVAVPALAQGPGGFQMTPEMRARMQQFQKWRDNHKHVMAVGRNIRGIEYLESKPATALNKAQAQKVLAVLKAWRTKKVMTNDQALVVNKQLTGSLNKAQVTALVTMPRQGRGGPGGGPGGGMRMGGPGGPGGGPGARPGGAGGPGGRPGGAGAGRGTFQLREYNPLNPDSIPMERMRASTKERLDKLTAKLAAKK